MTGPFAPGAEGGARRVLIKIGGGSVATVADRQRTMSDLAAVVRQGAHALVVHGGGPQATALARALGYEPTFKGGRRVTDAAMLDIVQMAVIGQLGGELLAAALVEGLRAVATPAASGAFVRGVRRPPRRVPGADEPVDFGLVADVQAVDPHLVEHLWAGGYLPICSCPVADSQGQMLNLNADTLVRSLAAAMRFDDVVYVADVPGVFRDLSRPDSHIPHIRASEIPDLIADGTVQGGMIAKLDEIAAVVRAGAGAAWIVGSGEPHAVSSALAGEPGRRTRVTA